MKLSFCKWWGGLLVLLFLVVGCNPTPGEGYFEADRFSYGDCDEKIFPWEPGFYTVDRFEENLMIRLQDIGGSASQVDGIFIRLDRPFVAARMNESEPERRVIPLGVPAEDGEVHASAHMGFYTTCPEYGRVVPELVGTIRFTSFEPYDDGQISGFIEAPEIVDRRTGEVLGENLTGDFRFLVQQGRPYSNFTGPGSE